jgi:hypothetical protein
VNLRFILPALGIFLLTARPGSAGEKWKEYTWKEGKCSFLLPGKPEEKKSILQLVSGTVTFFAYSGEVPELAKADAATIKKLFDSTRDMLLKSLKGEKKVLADKDIKLGTYPGRELKVATEPGSVYWTRLYQVGPRYYQLIVSGPRDAATTKAAEKFFGSFKVSM